MSKHWDNVRWQVEGDPSNIKEAGLLQLNCDKAFHILLWLPTLNFSQTVKMLIQWYKYYYEGDGFMYEFTLNQIKEYISIARNKKIPWTSQ
jgi:CDP-glucose 4,6-dehydratase